MACSRVACLVLAFVMLATHLVDIAAIDCPPLKQKLNPCMVYLKGRGGDSTRCCAAVKYLNVTLKRTVDRQTACKCIVAEVHGTLGLNLNLLVKLPKTCRVSIPGYKVRQNFDCKSIK